MKSSIDVFWIFNKLVNLTRVFCFIGNGNNDYDFEALYLKTILRFYFMCNFHINLFSLLLNSQSSSFIYFRHRVLGLHQKPQIYARAELFRRWKSIKVCKIICFELKLSGGFLVKYISWCISQLFCVSSCVSLFLLGYLYFCLSLCLFVLGCVPRITLMVLSYCGCYFFLLTASIACIFTYNHIFNWAFLWGQGS